MQNWIRTHQGTQIVTNMNTYAYIHMCIHTQRDWVQQGKGIKICIYMYTTIYTNARRFRNTDIFVYLHTWMCRHAQRNWVLPRNTLAYMYIHMHTHAAGDTDTLAYTMEMS